MGFDKHRAYRKSIFSSIFGQYKWIQNQYHRV